MSTRGLLPALPPIVNDSGSKKQQSRLKQPHRRVLPTASKTVKFPTLLRKLQLPKCNQDEEENAKECANNLRENEEEEERHGLSSSRTSSSSRSSLSHTKDKNRDFIKDLEEKKRKEKEDRARQERRKKKRHEKMTRKILLSAISRQKDTANSPEVDDIVNEVLIEPQEEEQDVAEAERRKEKTKKQKQLLKKQQELLAQIRAKQHEEQELQELEKKRKVRKREKVTQIVLHKIHAETEDEPICTNFNTKERDRQLKSKLLVEEPTEEQKLRAKEKRDVLQRKQQKYLQKLTDQRKQKQKEEEDAQLLHEKRKKKIQKEAQLRLQETAAKHQIVAEAREKEEAKAKAVEKATFAGPPVDLEAMITRLSKLKDRDVQIIPEARNFASWKKRNGVAQNQKVFCMTGWYPVIREELEKRGWFYNQDRMSPYFDFKWTLKSDELRAFKLEKSQFVNHFNQNAAITTKVGLLHNLRSAVWHQSVDIDEMFPRAYDLNDPMDMDNFIQDFRYGVAEGLLKQLARKGLQLKRNKSTLICANEALVAVVLDIAQKKVKSKRPENSNFDPLEESVDNPLSTELVTDLQWEVLTHCSLDKPGKIRASFMCKTKIYSEEKGFALSGECKSSALSAREKRSQRHSAKVFADAFNREKARLNDLMAHVSPVSDATFAEAMQFAQKLAKLCPQFHINGDAEFLVSESHPDTKSSQNVWIVKPAGMSRGRGIRVFNDLAQLFKYVDVENHKECQWIAQKYIENPFLLCKRKFDIRQWVLVTSWDPLTIWFNANCYLRFSSEEYSMDDLSDQYVHLTNNSIQKNSEKFNDIYATDDGEMQVEGNMWHSDDFKQFLSAKVKKPNIWENQLHPRMKEIVVQSLQCVQDMVQHRTNTCELYGYDFMVDDNLKPWLIEVNSSPACDYSTPIAKRYVETGLAGVIKVVVDHREYEMKKRSGESVGKEPDTGCWSRIHKAEYVGKPISSFAVDFQVKGLKMQRIRKNIKGSGVNSKMTASRNTKSVESTGGGSFLTDEDKSDENGLDEDEDNGVDERNERNEDDNKEEVCIIDNTEDEGDYEVDPLL